MNDELHDYEIVLGNYATIIECNDCGKVPPIGEWTSDPFSVYDFKAMDSEGKYVCKTYAFDVVTAKKIARRYVLDYLKEQGVLPDDKKKSYIISYENDNTYILYKIEPQNVSDGRILYKGEYNRYYLLIVTADSDDEAERKAQDIVKKDKDVSGKKQLFFPEFKERTNTIKMVWAAKRSRDEFIKDHVDRFNELTQKLEPHDKWNWEMLHGLKVTSQEYVVLFSDDAGDMFARRICDKYYNGEWNEEEYGDSFD
jgi:hypothetical protein